jgi:ketosteroid isomerase-like protein
MMQTASKTLIDLENRFWKAIVDEDADTAISMLTEPAYMVSPHGTMKFDHATYRKMAEEGSMIVKSYKLSDMDVVFPTEDTAVLTYKVKQDVAQRAKPDAPETQQMADSSTWVRRGDRWLCVMHTESPADAKKH